MKPENALKRYEKITKEDAARGYDFSGEPREDGPGFASTALEERITLTTICGRYADARRYARWGYAGTLASLKRRSGDPGWPEPPLKNGKKLSNYGFVVLNCQAAPLFSSLASQAPRPPPEAALMRDAMRFAEAKHVDKVRAFQDSSLVAGVRGDADDVAEELFMKLLLPSLLIGAKHSIEVGEKLREELRAARGPDGPKDSKAGPTEGFRHYDGAFAAVSKKDGSAFSKHFDWLWNEAAEGAGGGWQNWEYIGQSSLIGLLLWAEANIEAPLQGGSASALPGFAAAKYWAGA